MGDLAWAVFLLAAFAVPVVIHSWRKGPQRRPVWSFALGVALFAFVGLVMMVAMMLPGLDLGDAGGSPHRESVSDSIAAWYALYVLLAVFLVSFVVGVISFVQCGLRGDLGIDNGRRARGPAGPADAPPGWGDNVTEWSTGRSGASDTPKR